MLKIKTILLFFIILPAIVAGKENYLAGLYNLDIADNCVCHIELNKSGQYALTADVYATEDIIQCTVLSYGTYSIKNRKIILNDICQNITMSFIIEGKNKLKADNIFCFLKDKMFSLCSYGQDADLLPSFLIKNKTNIMQERSRHKNLNQTFIKVFTAGTYVNNWNAELYLSYGMTYTYKFNGLTVSAGTWDRYENELILFDTNLNHKFYILVEKHGLDCRLLPGYYPSVLQRY
jgi:hypothetical protein